MKDGEPAALLFPEYFGEARILIGIGTFPPDCLCLPLQNAAELKAGASNLGVLEWLV